MGPADRHRTQITWVTMGMRELDRLKCLQAVVDGDLNLTAPLNDLGSSSVCWIEFKWRCIPHRLVARARSLAMTTM